MKGAAVKKNLLIILSHVPGVHGRQAPEVELLGQDRSTEGQVAALTSSLSIAASLLCTACVISLGFLPEL
jgi:hypothetical protein